MKPVNFGSEGVGFRITGEVKNREPEFVRIAFPGGEVEVVRAKDGPDADYWVHLRVFRPEDLGRFPGDGRDLSRATDARLDIYGKHASDSNVGDFADPNLYHLAVRVTREDKR